MTGLKGTIENIKDGETVYLGGDTFHIYPDSITPVDRFYPGYGDVRNYCFVVRDKKNITIDGQGAELIFHGKVSPFNFVNCENITLKNFSVDYAVPGYAYGRVIAVTDDYFDLDFSCCEFSADITSDGSLKFFDKNDEQTVSLRCTLIEELGTDFVHLRGRYFLRVDPWKVGQPLSSMYREARFEKLGENLIRFYVKRNWENETKHEVGNYILFDLSGRNNVSFEFDACTDITLSDIELYASIGLAVITTNCKNLYANRVNSVIRENSGRIIAVKDDVFHLVATKGEVIIENCIFDRMIDDALNIHSFYPTVKEIVDKHTLLTEIICPQNRMLDLYRNGQKLKLLDSDHTDTGKVYTVCGHSYAGDKLIRLVIKEEVTEDITGFMLDDSIDAATLLLKNCKVTDTIGRVVVQTPAKAVVEDCYFHTTYTSLIVNGRSKTYSESAPVTDLTVRNNHFDGFGQFPAIITGYGCYNPENKIIHGRITVENNRFTANGENYMMLKYFDKVIIDNNTFEQDLNYRERPSVGSGGIITEYCNTVVIK